MLLYAVCKDENCKEFQNSGFTFNYFTLVTLKLKLVTLFVCFYSLKYNRLIRSIIWILNYTNCATCF